MYKEAGIKLRKHNISWASSGGRGEGIVRLCAGRINAQTHTHTHNQEMGKEKEKLDNNMAV